mgnify:CR=1 FL=1
MPNNVLLTQTLSKSISLDLVLALFCYSIFNTFMSDGSRTELHTYLIPSTNPILCNQVVIIIVVYLSSTDTLILQYH